MEFHGVRKETRDRMEAIYEYVKNHEGVSLEELSKAFYLSKHTMYRYIRQIKKYHPELSGKPGDATFGYSVNWMTKKRRQEYILDILMIKGYVKSDILAQALRVDINTIHKDVRALRKLYPQIKGRSGKYGGYYWEETDGKTN